MATVSASSAGVVIESSQVLLEAARCCGIIPGRHCDQLLAAVEGGTYPREATALAAKLVKKGLLTPYQGRYLLHGRGESLCAGRYVILDLLGEVRWARCTRPAIG